MATRRRKTGSKSSSSRRTVKSAPRSGRVKKSSIKKAVRSVKSSRKSAGKKR